MKSVELPLSMSLVNSQFNKCGHKSRFQSYFHLFYFIQLKTVNVDSGLSSGKTLIH